MAMKRKEPDALDLPGRSSPIPYEEFGGHSGRLGDLGEDQEKALHLFKKRVSFLESDDDLTPTILAKALPYAEDDQTLLRLLRARDFDVDAAQHSLIEILKWRESFGVDERWETHKKGSPAWRRWQRVWGEMNFACGVDLGGAPISIARVQRLNIWKRDLEDMKQYCVHQVEQITHSLPPGRDTFTILFDLSGFSLSNMDYPFVSFLIGIFEKYYPERLRYFLIHNAPWLFKTCWRVISGSLAAVCGAHFQRIAAKIIFTYGEGYPNEAQIADYIARDQLMIELGGTNAWQPIIVEEEEE